MVAIAEHLLIGLDRKVRELLLSVAIVIIEVMFVVSLMVMMMVVVVVVEAEVEVEVDKEDDLPRELVHCIQNRAGGRRSKTTTEQRFRFACSSKSKLMTTTR